MKERSDITESDLARSDLTNEEKKFARVLLNLPAAGGGNSATRSWFYALGDEKRTKLSESVTKKISKMLRADD